MAKAKILNKDDHYDRLMEMKVTQKMTYTQIADELNKEGLTTSTGSPISNSNVSTFMIDCGYRIKKRTKKVSEAEAEVEEEFTAADIFKVKNSDLPLSLKAKIVSFWLEA